VKILVVDDHPMVRQMAARLLVCLGHEAVEARDARDAEARMRQGDGLEVVLLDMRLDGTDGAAVAQRLQDAHPGLRILFMSGDGEETFVARALGGPRRGFIEKPFSLKTLETALQRLLAG
jgi:two-component system C4-dicarboxylate transport response regulator DctD